MDSIKKLWIAVVVVAIIAVVGLFTPVAQKLFGGLQNQPDVSTTNYTSLSVQNGESNGGLWTTATRITMAQATSTLCAIQSPNATSTLTLATISMTSSAPYATNYELASDRTAFGSTTALVLSYGTGTNGVFGFIATSTQLTDLIVGPSTWVNFKLSTSSASALFAPVGTCSAEFQVL